MGGVRRSLGVIALVFLGATAVHAQPQRCDQLFQRASWWSSQTHPQNLAQLRTLAQKRGLHIAVDLDYNATESKELPLVAGADVLNARFKKSPDEPIRVPGLVLHLGELPRLSRFFRGEANPFIYDASFAYLMDDKWAEYQFATQIDAGAMAPSRNLADILAQNSLLEQKRSETRMQFEAFLRGNAGAGALATNLRAYLDAVFTAVQDIYPDGAFLKQTSEAATGDQGGLITTFETGVDDLLAKMSQTARQLRQEFQAKKGLQNQLQAWLTKGDRRTAILVSFLVAPEKLFWQQKLELMKTGELSSSGRPIHLEFRVNFLNGKPITVVTRFGHGYFPEEAKRAMQYVTDFFAKAPEQARQLSGGADVAFQADGTPVFIEFNFGGQSAFMDPMTELIPGNQFISELLGEPTPVLQKLEGIFESPIETQQKWLRRVRVKSPDSIRHFEQITSEELAMWLRDRSLQEWDKNPTQANAEFWLNRLEQAFQAWDKIPTFATQILQSARDYLERQLH